MIADLSFFVYFHVIIEQSELYRCYHGQFYAITFKNKIKIKIKIVNILCY